MKIHLAVAIIVLLSFGDVHAFSVPKPKKASSRNLALEGQRNNNWMAPVTATAMGWALASQVAVAGMVPPLAQEQTTTTPALTSSSTPSTLVAVEKLDFALPSYDDIGKSKGGFGEGTEARLGLSDSMYDPGINEKAKQSDAMKKAEEARLAKKKETALRRQQQYEADQKAAELKKADTSRRLKEIFN